MTYCAGILVREGLVMIADTRTNAGSTTFHLPKAHVFATGKDRTLALPRRATCP